MLHGIQHVGLHEWDVPVGYAPDMRVSGRLYLSEALGRTLEEGAVRQCANVATLPGIIGHSYGMPDIHWGYGFPIGGVAAFSRDGGVISPGGVGFDINCGVRLITIPLEARDLRDLESIIARLYDGVPTGVGSKSSFSLSRSGLLDLVLEGSPYAIKEGFGLPEDASHCEEGGCMKEASLESLSDKAIQRGIPQCGTLGSGNHFLELQVVSEIRDREAADTFGITEGMVCCMIHCGSRGFGHQVCTDHIKTLDKASKKYGIKLPDRQLACAPLTSPEGEGYFSAMAAAANYAWANRQIITHQVRTIFESAFGIAYREMPLVYDVAHNIAKWEMHEVDGENSEVCVHRKGATRAFGPGRHELPGRYQKTGQPVIIPGSMGTASYLLRGTDTAMQKTFGSTCHGAGRVSSRKAAKKAVRGADISMELRKQGIIVKAPSGNAIAEEAPQMYKSSDEVVRVVDEAGLSTIVSRLMPLGVIKG
ncbi:MAG: RtcB family protein [Methanocalculus sp. MSAO_Arc1]|uniref:RtcB family protein n=1 Tax=Methanocalculus TaxID=71151 RepID=UPI000FF644B7|nr:MULTISPECIES: RtcB family protein [unclassified Methanocalculus]MCP1661726.1 tRNA-splicing ligase RtcB [Methanocalculus sp. AMF5]RQD79401.1 MAG: RtcB family protein [Methanocalculus sp. MSAO_Arc1]